MNLSLIDLDSVRIKDVLTLNATFNNDGVFTIDFRNIKETNPNISQLNLAQYSLSLYDVSNFNRAIELGIPIVTSIKVSNPGVRLKGFLEYTDLDARSYVYTIDKIFNKSSGKIVFQTFSNSITSKPIESDEDLINHLIEKIKYQDIRLSVLENQLLNK
jgi:hypothetical protein